MIKEIQKTNKDVGRSIGVEALRKKEGERMRMEVGRGRKYIPKRLYDEACEWGRKKMLDNLNKKNRRCLKKGINPHLAVDLTAYAVFYAIKKMNLNDWMVGADPNISGVVAIQNRITKEIKIIKCVAETRHRNIEKNDNCLIPKSVVRNKDYDYIVYGSFIDELIDDYESGGFYIVELIGGLYRKEISSLLKKYRNRTGKGIKKASYIKKDQYIPNNQRPRTASEEVYVFTTEVVNKTRPIHVFIEEILEYNPWNNVRMVKA